MGGERKDWDNDPLASPIEPVTDWPNQEDPDEILDRITQDPVTNIGGALAKGIIHHNMTPDEAQEAYNAYLETFLDEPPPAA